MRFYEALLHLYPASFRGEYGNEMRKIFAQRRRDASGFLAAAVLWIETFFDVLFNAMAVHWDILRQDLLYTWRTLARTPGFAITAVLVVALGVGANTAAFTVTDFVLLRPLPFHEPELLVKLWETTPGYSRMELSPANYRDWKRMSTSFDAMGAFVPISVNLVGQGDPERIEGTSVTADLFPLLGSHPSFGRAFTSADEREGAAGTLLLSHRLWQAAFGGDPGVLVEKSSWTTLPTPSSKSCLKISTFRIAKRNCGRRNSLWRRTTRSGTTTTSKSWPGSSAESRWPSPEPS
jgi:putative ABC transport system permease protein